MKLNLVTQLTLIASSLNRQVALQIGNRFKKAKIAVHFLKFY